MHLTRTEAEQLVEQDPSGAVQRLLAQAERIATLERQVDRLMGEAKGTSPTSQNSHHPPSSDRPGTVKRPGKRKPSGRRAGGQVGHRGETLRLVATPDEVVAHRPAVCGGCGEELPAEGGVIGSERRQVVELAPIRRQITEHRVTRVCCVGCGATTMGVFPGDVRAPMQYGPGVLGMGVYLRVRQLLPSERTAEVLSELLGTAVSVATIEAAVKRGAQTLAAVEAAVATAISQAEVVHADETGLDVEGKGAWLHVASTSRLTHYGVHAKRGRVAMDELGVVGRVRGVMVHDDYASYQGYRLAQHASCNAHHLRELTGVVEADAKQTWAEGLKTLLVTIKRHIAAAKATGATRIDGATQAQFEAEYAALVTAGEALNPRVERQPGQRGRVKQSVARNLLERLWQRRDQVLAFMTDWRVPFDNNQAERDLRMMKVQQKISGTFRTAAGAHRFCRWRGYLSSLQKQGQRLLDAITRTLQGAPPLPQLAS